MLLVLQVANATIMYVFWAEKPLLLLTFVLSWLISHKMLGLGVSNAITMRVD